MDHQRFKNLQEHALIALTYLECDQNVDRQQANENKKMILETYDKSKINEGAMLVLAALITYEAYALETSFENRVAQIRQIVRDGLSAETTDPDA